MVIRMYMQVQYTPASSRPLFNCDNFVPSKELYDGMLRGTTFTYKLSAVLAESFGPCFAGAKSAVRFQLCPLLNRDDFVLSK